MTYTGTMENGHVDQRWYVHMSRRTGGCAPVGECQHIKHVTSLLITSCHMQ